jgi:hypothetical protein
MADSEVSASSSVKASRLINGDTVRWAHYRRRTRAFTSCVVVLVERVMLEILRWFCYSRAPQSLPVMLANGRPILVMKFKWG